MAKNSIFNRYFLLIILCFSSVIAYPVTNTSRRNLTPNELRDSLGVIFSNEVGVRELTGKNDGKRVEEYLASCKLRKGDPYCAAFITWSFIQVGIKAVISGYSPSWFPKANTIYYRNNANNKITPLKGDVIGIYIKDKGRVGHVGFVESWPESSSFCTTVEANTSLSTNGGKNDYDGQGVERKRRIKSQIYRVSRWIF